MLISTTSSFLQKQLETNTYLGIAEIDLFPSFKQSQGILAKALDLNGEFLNLPFRIDQSSTTKGISFSAWVNPRQVKGGC